MASGALPISRTALYTLLVNQGFNYHQQAGMKVFRRSFAAPRVQIRFVDHHLAHAISAYAYSGLDDTAVLVIDGRGAWEATSLWRGRNGSLEHIWTIPFPNSLGLFYAQFTHFLGFTPYSDEWKVMGLAPYGKEGIDVSAFISPNARPYRVAARRLLGNSTAPLAELEAHFGPARIPESEIEPKHKDLAFAVQAACEEAIITLASEAVKVTECRNLCLAGGVALNSKANGKLEVSGLVDRLFVQPAASDDGACLGSALAPYLENGKRLPINRLRSMALGNECSDGDVERTLNTFKIRAEKVRDVAARAARLLADGKVIGWVQGRMEFGPRALGQRSILADPRIPDMTTKVNNAVKFREWWRPFAPSILAEFAHEYLESATDSPFMILTAQVRPEKRNVIPAVTHADGSARPQSVERAVNPLYWNLIHEFHKITNVPVVMNTSFNLRGEPIVTSPTDAIRTFYSSGLDSLVIGNFVVEK
jgi:carbamoyltransferase